MNRERILLTGGSGTLGRNLLEIIGNKPNLEILSLLREKSRSLSRHASVTEVRADFSDRQNIASILKMFNPKTVIHCAATGMESPQTEWFEMINFNVEFSVNLCEIVARAGASHFLFIGSGLAYRALSRPLQEDDALDTLHPYGASKAAGDFLVRAAAVEFGLPLTVLRPFSFTGLWDDRRRLFPSLLRAASVGDPFDLSSGQQVRDHLSARDVALGILAALKNPPPSATPAIYNLGSGSSLSVRQLVEDVVAELEIPVQLNFGGVTPHAFEPSFLVANCSKANKELGWQPRHRLAHAVWELSRESFPQIHLREPKREIL